MNKERIREMVEEEAKKSLAVQLNTYNELVQQYAVDVQCADVEVARKFLHEKKFLVPQPSTKSKSRELSPSSIMSSK
jgi:hypothetical protein